MSKLEERTQKGPFKRINFRMNGVSFSYSCVSFRVHFSHFLVDLHPNLEFSPAFFLKEIRKIVVIACFVVTNKKTFEGADEVFRDHQQTLTFPNQKMVGKDNGGPFVAIVKNLRLYAI